MASSLFQQGMLMQNVLTCSACWVLTCVPPVRCCLTIGSEDLGSGVAPSSAPAGDPSKKLGRVSQFLGKLQLRKRVAGGIRQLAEQTAQSISKYVLHLQQIVHSFLVSTYQAILACPSESTCKYAVSVIQPAYLKGRKPLCLPSSNYVAVSLFLPLQQTAYLEVD